MRRIFTIGETVYDIIFRGGTAAGDLPAPVSATPGGAMLNTAVSLGRLKQPVSLISEYADDLVGGAIDSFLENNGVSTSYIHRYKAGHSPLALAFLDERNDAHYTFYKIFPEKRLAIDAPDFSADDIVLFGSFFAITAEVRPYLMKLLEKARKSRCCIIYDPNFRESHMDELPAVLPLIEENISMADIVRASDEDLKNILGAETPSEGYAGLRKYGSPVMVYTASSSGVTVMDEGPELHLDVPSIEPVSTIGAGDTFNSGIIYSLIKENILKEDIPGLSREKWRAVMERAIAFSTHVCLSYENYIDRDFAAMVMGS